MVTKTIADGAAGVQGASRCTCRVTTTWSKTSTSRERGGRDSSTTIADLPVGTACTVTEPTAGAVGRGVVNTDIGGNAPTITAEEVGVDVINTYKEPTTPDTRSSSDSGEQTSTSSGSGGDLASNGASAGLGLMLPLELRSLSEPGPSCQPAPGVAGQSDQLQARVGNSRTVGRGSASGRSLSHGRTPSTALTLS